MSTTTAPAINTETRTAVPPFAYSEECISEGVAILPRLGSIQRDIKSNTIKNAVSNLASSHPSYPELNALLGRMAKERREYDVDQGLTVRTDTEYRMDARRVLIVRVFGRSE